MCTITYSLKVIKVSSSGVVKKIERVTIEILFKIVVFYLNADFKGNIMAH